MASFEEAIKQPALREYVAELEASVPGAVVRYARNQLFTGPDSQQKLHGDAFQTEGVSVCPNKVRNQNLFKICFSTKTFISVAWQVRSILTLATGGIVKEFTVRDSQEATEVTLHVPNGTLLLGSDRFFGVLPHTRFKHGVEANRAIVGDECKPARDQT